MFKYFFFILTLFFLSSSNAADSLLTLKQQLDRLQREVSDLSKSVFTGSHDILKEKNNESKQSSNFAALDLRIYDLEKDIKILNENFEDLVFQIDEIKILFNDLAFSLDNKSLNNQEKKESEEIRITQTEVDKEENELVKSENILGTIVISSKDLSNKNDNQILNEDSEVKINSKLNPEDQYQLAFDLLRKGRFNDAKIVFKKFIDNNKKNELSGSAHYWIGEINLLNKEYREAALIFAEGYQKFPNNIKAPDILYKLSESLIAIEKRIDACNTLEKFSIEYPNHKFIVKTLNKMSELECKTVVE